MAANVTKVWLSAPSEGWREEFPLEQAERMLALRRAEWVLDDDKFVYEDGKIRRATGK